MKFDVIVDQGVGAGFGVGRGIVDEVDIDVGDEGGEGFE